MAHVYILQSLKNDKYYIGSSDNLSQRIKDHIAGNSYATKRLLPVKLVFKQEFSSMNQARRMERKLKGLKRRDYLEKIIADGEIKSC